MDTIIYLVKEASDADEAINLAAELTEQGYLNDYDFYKMASAYDAGYLDTYYAQQDAANFMLDKIAEGDAAAATEAATEKKENFLKRKVKEFGGAIKGKWDAASPLTKKILKGTGIGAGLATVGGAGYLIGKRNRG